MTPTGHRIELYAESGTSDPKPRSPNPDVWEVEPHGMAARRLDHSLVYGPNIEQTLDFFEKALDFRCAEPIDLPDGLLAVWLSCSMKAHDIAFVKTSRSPASSPSRIRTRSWQAVGRAADIITHYELSIDTRPDAAWHHRGQTIYFFDPLGRPVRSLCRRLHILPGIVSTRTWTRARSAKGSSFYYERQLNDAFLSVVS